MFSSGVIELGAGRQTATASGHVGIAALIVAILGGRAGVWRRERADRLMAVGGGV